MATAEHLPREYLGLVSFLDRQSGRDSGGSALKSALGKVSPDVWFETFTSMMSALVPLPRCATIASSKDLYNCFEDFNDDLVQFANLTHSVGSHYCDVKPDENILLSDGNPDTLPTIDTVREINEKICFRSRILHAVHSTAPRLSAANYFRRANLSN